MRPGKMDSPPIVCGVDGSEQSRRAFHEAVRFALALDTHLEVVMAWQPMRAYFPDQGPAPKLMAFEILDEIVRAEFGDSMPEWVRVRAEPGHPGKVLVDASRTAELLVVGSRGLSELASPFLGSVSLYCTTQAECPVLVVRSEEESKGKRP